MPFFRPSSSFRNVVHCKIYRQVLFNHVSSVRSNFNIRLPDQCQKIDTQAYVYLPRLRVESRCGKRRYTLKQVFVWQVLFAHWPCVRTTNFVWQVFISCWHNSLYNTLLSNSIEVFSLSILFLTMLKIQAKFYTT